MAEVVDVKSVNGSRFAITFQKLCSGIDIKPDSNGNALECMIFVFRRTADW